MLSDAAKEVLEIAREAFTDGAGSKHKIVYEMDFTNTRPDSNNEVLSTIQFTLDSPISDTRADEIISEMYPLISEVLGNRLAATVAANLVVKQGISKKLSEKSGATMEVTFLDEPSDFAKLGSAAAVHTAAGRFSSQLNMKASLELLMKENLLKTMTGASAGTGINSPLKNRTGRFVNSASVDSIHVPDKASKHISIYYRYMVYPYQVFDPKNTRSPHMGLASKMRNPQNLIGDALAGAARRLLSSKYKVTIRQVY